jgi:hypothetical protein
MMVELRLWGQLCIGNTELFVEDLILFLKICMMWLARRRMIISHFMGLEHMEDQMMGVLWSPIRYFFFVGGGGVGVKMLLLHSIDHAFRQG